MRGGGVFKVGGGAGEGGNVGEEQRAGSQGEASVVEKQQRGQRSRHGRLGGEGGGGGREKEQSGPASSWRMSCSGTAAHPPPLLRASTRLQLSFSVG